MNGNTQGSRHKVVIVGAGFGGLSAAMALKNADVDVTVIDRQNHHLFQPLLYQVATAALTPAEIAAPIRSVLKDQMNTTVFMDAVIGVDPKERRVHTAGGRDIVYDTLVLATGARHSYFGNDSWAAHAPGLKTIDDATRLRQRILLAFENAEMVEDDRERRADLTFLIVGGGPTGVEMAGAIAELARSVSHDFRNIDAKSARTILVEGGPRILPQFDEKLSAQAEEDLAELGVEVRTNAMVTEISDGVAKVGDEELAVSTMIWAAGVQASRAAQWLGVEASRAGHVVVGPDLTVPGYPEIYAIGDTASHMPEGAARPLPGVAPVAKQMGQYVGHRIKRIAAGKDPGGRFRYHDLGSMATIGRNHAIAEMGRLKIRGLIGWLFWGIAHIYFLIGFRNRIAVLFSWIWAYITWQRGVRLITGINGTKAIDAASSAQPAELPPTPPASRKAVA